MGCSIIHLSTHENINLQLIVYLSSCAIPSMPRKINTITHFNSHGTLHFSKQYN